MRLWVFLRSRRLAIALLASTTAYMVIASLVPAQIGGAPGAIEWYSVGSTAKKLLLLLGMDTPYQSPLFLGLTFMTALSTAACALERTLDGVRVLSRDPADSAVARRLSSRPHISISHTSDKPLEDIEAEVARALRKSGLVIRHSDGPSVASSRSFSVIGSPLFHWSLALIFVLVGLGQLSRYEGHLNLLPGQVATDSASPYGESLSQGPLATRRYSNRRLRAVDVRSTFFMDGHEREGAALVELFQGATAAKRTWVYPNHALVDFPLYVHRVRINPAVVGSVRSAETSSSQPFVLYFDFEDPSPRSFEVASGSGEGTITVKMTPVGGARLAVSVSPDSDSGDVGAGEQVKLTDDLTLSLDELTYYAQLRVVNDWTVPFLYSLFVSAIIGAAMAIFLPYRQVRWLLTEETADQDHRRKLRLNVLVSARKIDPAFRGQVDTIIRQSLTEDVDDTRRHDAER